MVYKGNTHRIIYWAYRSTTGITDITVDIYNPSGTKEIDGAALTELAGGSYYYDYDTSSSDIGSFAWTANSATAEYNLKRVGSFEVINNPWNEALSEYKTHGTMGYKLQHMMASFSRQPRFQGVWNTDDKAELLSTLAVITERLKNLESKIITSSTATTKVVTATLGSEKKVDGAIREISQLKDKSNVLQNIIMNSEKSNKTNFEDYKDKNDKNIERLTKLILTFADSDSIKYVVETKEEENKK